ncbi:hypothetical protein BDV25DRAFT_135115 [Aspergillus avenaceus]|uniref:Uncharacterized protein n=1 Tax=Aspergillus avenaceus TaxID=36643 RepID=A0A5N6U9U4_ASPAV|nr:hypothetical protein BDV25DRAFT_135115 [Aspergillus avenaceus]
MQNAPVAGLDLAMASILLSHLIANVVTVRGDGGVRCFNHPGLLQPEMTPDRSSDESSTSLKSDYQRALRRTREGASQSGYSSSTGEEPEPPNLRIADLEDEPTGAVDEDDDGRVLQW